MAQAAFPFETGIAAPCAGTRPSLTGRAGDRVSDRTHTDGGPFAIGWDYARHRLTPPLAHLQAESPVHQGWLAGRAAFGGRTLRATPATGRWLQLRLEAWMRGLAFEEVLVTPGFLRRIDAGTCPVSRSELTGEPGADSEAVCERVSTRAGIAAGNLAMMSRRVARARGDLDWEQALARGRRLGDEGRGQVDGLDADAWTRLGVLMSFATPLPHRVAATVPLRVLPPVRVRVINPVQAWQVMLSMQFGRAGYARRVATLAAWLPDGDTRQCFQVFMHTLLARRLAVGATASVGAVREGLEDAWGDPLVNRRWQRLALRLSDAECERLLERAARRGLTGGELAWLGTDRATEGWALESAGFDQSLGTADSAAGASGARMPGKVRSSGSQKLASCDAEIACDAFQ